MQNITNRPETARKEGELVRPDLVVLGGGAWDRLHVYGTDEEIASHRSALKDLTNRDSKCARCWYSCCMGGTDNDKLKCASY